MLLLDFPLLNDDFMSSFSAREIENVNWEALLNEEVARLRGSEATNKEEGGDFDFDFDDDDDDALSEISNPSLLSVEIITDTVEAAKKPTVAAIDGLALGGGGGLELAMVENKSGLSNFIPILIEDKEICSEMRTLQQSRTSDVDVTQLLNCMQLARDVINQNHQKGRGIIVHSETEGFRIEKTCTQDSLPSVSRIKSQDVLSRTDSKCGIMRIPTFNDKIDRIPLLKREIIMNMEELPKRSSRRYVGRGFLSSRPAMFVIVSVAVCLAVCVAILHRGRVSELAVSIRRCLFNSYIVFTLLYDYCMHSSVSEFLVLQVKEEAQQLAQIFETVRSFKVKRKCGKEKLIFGSVIAQDLVDIIKAQLQREVDKRIVELLEIHETEEYITELKLYPEVTARIRLNVFAN
ncbi:hypothetical protein Ahy_B08g093479 [Arachis hypogaea]|uniref:Large ribosomal subunit protein bL9 C-terminal domain-containing protein n=3 Tax=Arachis TaxID=3817 RepID=A0A444Y698_ARAHY|nr:hypothetical protein Ahy_B08g093479 [Arachis hypogaea]